MAEAGQELGLEAAMYVTSGVTAALLSAPFISIVDKAITSNASGREPLWTCMGNGFRSLVTQPRTFLRQPSFIWIAFVYGGTYVAANLTQMACEVRGVDWQYPKFIAASAANISLSMAKDRAFARMFSAVGAAPRSFPVTSLALFGLRDTSTVVASFNLPPLISPLLEAHFGVTPFVARTTAQLFTPLAMQIFSVPMHLWALDLYNRPGVSLGERASFVAREYAKTVVARWARILPAFGIGGVINNELQRVLRVVWSIPSRSAAH